MNLFAMSLSRWFYEDFKTVKNGINFKKIIAKIFTVLRMSEINKERMSKKNSFNHTIIINIIHVTRIV